MASDLRLAFGMFAQMFARLHVCLDRSACKLLIFAHEAAVENEGAARAFVPEFVITREELASAESDGLRAERLGDAVAGNLFLRECGGHFGRRHLDDFQIALRHAVGGKKLVE